MDSIHEKAIMLSQMLVENGLTLSLAESCTGGLISELITRIPGSSLFFAGCSVTYSNGSKMDVLGIEEKTLKEHGAVSIETAEEMAVGVRELYETDVSASVTGIAGPSGGTIEKPIGTVCIAVSYGDRMRSERFRFEGDRDTIRMTAAEKTIDMIMEMLG